MRSAFATTCWLVTIQPSGSTTKPAPVPRCTRPSWAVSPAPASSPAGIARVANTVTTPGFAFATTSALEPPKSLLASPRPKLPLPNRIDRKTPGRAYDATISASAKTPTVAAHKNAKKSPRFVFISLLEGRSLRTGPNLICRVEPARSNCAGAFFGNEQAKMPALQVRVVSHVIVFYYGMRAQCPTNFSLSRPDRQAVWKMEEPSYSTATN